MTKQIKKNEQIEQDRWMHGSFETLTRSGSGWSGGDPEAKSKAGHWDSFNGVTL